MFRSCCCASSLPPLEGNVWLLYHHLNGELFLPRLSQGFFFLSLQLCFLFHTLFQWLLFFFLLLPATAVCYILWFLHRNSRTGWITGSMQVSWSHDRIRNFLLRGGGGRGAHVWVHRWKAFPLRSGKKKFSHHNNKTHRVSATSTTTQTANPRVQSARYLICIKRC